MSLFHLPSLISMVTKEDKATTPWIELFTNLISLLNQGYPPSINNSRGQAIPQSVTIPIAKLTGGGANGSLTFTNGILTATVAPT